MGSIPYKRSFYFKTLHFSNSTLIQKNTITKTILIDFLKKEDEDWLDRSQAFIPYTGWFETGYKELVDFPKEHIFSFFQNSNIFLNNTLDVGSDFSFYFRALDVYYHGAIIVFRPLIHFLLNRDIGKKGLYLNTILAPFGYKKHLRYRRRKSLGNSNFLNGSISFLKTSQMHSVMKYYNKVLPFRKGKFRKLKSLFLLKKKKSLTVGIFKNKLNILLKTKHKLFHSYRILTLSRVLRNSFLIRLRDKKSYFIKLPNRNS